MKTITIIVRVLIGLLLIYASSSYFLKLAPEPVTTGNFKVFQVGLIASEYIMPLAKTIEFLCGLAFVTGKFVTLASIVVLPITLNILLINYFMAPETLPIAIALFFGNLYLIYQYWDNCKAIFTP